MTNLFKNLFLITTSFILILSSAISQEPHRNNNYEKDGDEGDIKKRDEWFVRQRAYPYPQIPEGMRAEAIRETQRLYERHLRTLKNSSSLNSTSANPKWEEVGPKNVGGRIRAIAIHPQTSGTMLIGAAAGGVWKTTDNGGTWTPTFDFQTAIAICAITYDPINPNIVYAGTGESTNNVYSYLGDGIFKSTDGGDTWKSLGLSNVGAISAIAVSPTNNRIMYVTSTKSNQGFYRTTDGGVTWKNTSSGNYYDMTVNPLNFNEVYVSSETSVMRSLDAGLTFTKVTNGMNVTGGVRISIAIAPSNTSKVYALIARNTATAQLGEVYVFNATSLQWSLIATLPNNFFGQNGQGWYDNCISVHPKNDKVVLVGGIDIYRTNNGQTFTNVTNSYGGGNVHPDQHLVRFDPKDPKTVMIGNDGGIYASVDTGKKWNRLFTKLGVTQFYKMDLDQTKFYRLYGGSQDNGTWGSFGTTAIPDNWSSVYGGDGFYALVDLGDPNYVYAENYNGENIRRLKVNASGLENNGASMDPNQKIQDAGAWVSPMAMSSVDKKSFFTGQSKLWRTTDYGKNWTALSPGNSAKISAIGLCKKNINKMLIGSGSGEVSYSSDGGTTWTDSKGTPGRYCSEIEYDPVDENLVYAVFSGSGTGKVYVSTDNGANFKSISTGIPNIPVNAIEINPANTQQIYIATDVGVYATLDKGVNWFPFIEGLANAPIVDLKIHKNQNMMYAATHGRSMWRVAIGQVKEPALLLYPIGGESFVSPIKIQAKWSGFTGMVNVQISLDGGETYKTIVENTLANYDSILLPRVRTTKAKIKVIEIASGTFAESGNFSLNPKTNTSEISNRGFVVQALTAKDNFMWGSVLGSEKLYSWSLPLSNLSKRDSLELTDIPQGIKDMAYSPSSKMFYLLYNKPDGSQSKIVIMDTLGKNKGELPLPAQDVVGVAANSWGVFVITSGESPKVYQLDKNGTVIAQRSVEGLSGKNRISLEWDETGFVQGVTNRDTTEYFRSEIHRFRYKTNFATGTVSADSVVALVPSGMTEIQFFGLTYYNGGGDNTRRQYICTDTAGVIRVLPQFQFVSSVDMDSKNNFTNEFKISPNPAVNRVSLGFNLMKATALRLEVFNANGDLISKKEFGNFEVGKQNLEIETNELASGIYFFVLSNDLGLRKSSSVTIIK